MALGGFNSGQQQQCVLSGGRDAPVLLLPRGIEHVEQRNLLVYHALLAI